MVTLEFGWRLGNILTPQYAEVDFFAVRFRSDDTEFHVARWTGRPDFDAGKPVYAAGVGYVFDSEDEGEINDKRWDASFTPGLAWTSQSRSNRPYPLSAFYRAAVGYGNPGGNWDLQTAVSSYFRLIDPEYTTDTFGTLALQHKDLADNRPVETATPATTEPPTTEPPTTEPPTTEPPTTEPPTTQPPTPPSGDACKNGGWGDYTDENGRPFRNQGECQSWFVQQ